jgi:O-antigen/teichoic acid export membrane protein
LKDIRTILKNRLLLQFIGKLLSNVISGLASFFNQALLARFLGPAGYGNFMYLNNFFENIIQLGDSGSSTCYYTKLSKHKQRALVNFYFLYSFLLLFILILFNCVIKISDVYKIIVPDQEYRFLHLSVIFVFGLWFHKIIQKTADAYHLTLISELMLTVYKIILVLSIASLVYFKIASGLIAVYFINIGLISLLCFLMILYFKFKLKFCLKLPTSEELRKYYREFYQYVGPLVLAAIVGFICLVGDRWLLQSYSGSLEQGFYSISFQIGTICFLVTSSVAPLFMREVSVAINEKNHLKMQYYFSKFVPILYFMTCVLSCFLFTHARIATNLIGGEKFNDATVAVGIMVLYPIHQTLGQLCGAFFYASEETGLYGRISMIISLIGLPLTIFLLAPSTSLGLDLGSMGLALKTVLIQFLSVNILLFFIARKLKLRFVLLIFFEFMAVIVCVLLSIFSNLISQSMFNIEHKVIQMLIDGTVYLMTLFMLYKVLPLQKYNEIFINNKN